MGKYQNCPKHVELDIYSPCAFDCIYCIAKAVCNQGVIKPVDIEGALTMIMRADGADPFYLSPWTDCYTAEERQKKYARRIVKTLAEQNLPFFVITKSPLVLRDVDFFVGRENAFIAVSLNTIDDSITRVFEPKAPSASERKELIEELVAIPNLKTVVKIDPILPGITDNARLERLSEWLCSIKPTAVTVETLRISRDMAERLLYELPRSAFSKLIQYYDRLDEIPSHPSSRYRLPLFKSLKDTFLSRGVKVSFCRATVSVPLTPYDCRGGYP
jgi:DNA repair photolyase